ncbi:MAG TPA: tail fiber protein [Verrucomicrobiae bacterium]
MSDQFVGEIRIVPFNFAPTGWAFCNGQLLPISQNTALFSLLGTFYGGDGKSNFALPNLQGAAPIDQGQGPGLSDYILGQTGGASSVTLISSEMPVHNHVLNAQLAGGDVNTPAANTWAKPHLGKTGINLYNNAAGTSTTMSAQAMSLSGGSQPHNNLMPYLTLNFIIALQGIFPSRG